MYVMGFFIFWGSKLPQIKIYYLCHKQNAYTTHRGRYQMNFTRENKPYSEFSEFSKTHGTYM